jgi:hypothetical protein
MKKLNLIVVTVITLLMLHAGMAAAQEFASATARASATIIIPLTATESAQLNFGKFFPGEQGGTVIISPAGDVSTSATVVAAAGQRNPGSFFVTGQVDAAFAIDLPDGPAILTNADSKTMVVSDWVTIPANTDAGIKLEGGAQTVMIGATLTVGSADANPKGIYSGTYQVTFAYN